jgi:hypothetical protein
MSTDFKNSFKAAQEEYDQRIYQAHAALIEVINKTVLDAIKTTRASTVVLSPPLKEDQIEYLSQHYQKEGFLFECDENDSNSKITLTPF